MILRYTSCKLVRIQFAHHLFLEFCLQIFMVGGWGQIGSMQTMEHARMLAAHAIPSHSHSHCNCPFLQAQEGLNGRTH